MIPKNDQLFVTKDRNAVWWSQKLIVNLMIATMQCC